MNSGRPLPGSRTMYAAAAASLLCAGGVRSAYGAPGRPVSLTQYHQLIGACRRAVDSDDTTDKDLAALKERLAVVTSVTRPDGVVIPVDTDPIAEALNSSYDNPPEISDRLDVLDYLLTPGSFENKAGDPRAQARDILAGSEFARRRDPDDDSNGKEKEAGWWQSFRKWLRKTGKTFSDWLNKLLKDTKPEHDSTFAGAPLLADFILFLLYFILAVAAVVAVYFLGRAVVGSPWLKSLRKRKRRGEDEDMDLDLRAENIADPLGAANAYASRGEYRSAVRLAYIAALRRLAESGLITPEPNRTNWEYQRALRRRSRPLHDVLLPATRLFDRVWYGRRTATAAEFEAIVDIYNALPVVPSMGGEEAEASAPEEEALRP